MLEEVSLAQGDDSTPFLSPVKTKVGNGISFKDIRLARVLLGYFKKPKEGGVETAKTSKVKQEPQEWQVAKNREEEELEPY